MAIKNDILTLVNEQEKKAAKAGRQALIIQPGAIGDCILTLPLAQFMKSSLNLGGIVFLGHLGYADIFAGRSCVDGVKSIESVNLHRLFVNHKEFDLEDNDPLLTAFAPYSWIVTFLGEPDSDFERNLLYTAHCTHSAEVVTLPLKPPAALKTHISSFYIEKITAALETSNSRSGLGTRDSNDEPQATCNERLLTATGMDKLKGAEFLKTYNIDPISQKVVVIACGSGSPIKCWPIENFITVAGQFIKIGFKVIFLLGPAELERFDSSIISRLGSTAPCVSDISLTEVLQILSVSYAFVGNDSGIAHLSGALGTKTIAVFGPTQSNIYQPCGPNVHTLQIPLDEFTAISSQYQEQITHIASHF